MDIFEALPKLGWALIGLFASVGSIRVINVTLGIKYADKVANLSGIHYAVYHSIQYAAVLGYMGWMLK
jgi:hypothetical protein